jgi:hypothetical protein
MPLDRIEKPVIAVAVDPHYRNTAVYKSRSNGTLRRGIVPGDNAC